MNTFPPRNELESSITCGATKQEVISHGVKCKKSDLPAIIRDICDHLDSIKQANFLALFKKNEELYDGTLEYFQKDHARFDLQLGTKPYNGRPFPVPCSRMVVFKREVQQLVTIGVLKKQLSSEW